MNKTAVLALSFAHASLCVARGRMNERREHVGLQTPAPVDDDATLIRLARARDARAPALIWDKFAPRVRGIVGRALRGSVDVDDLVQEVFLRVFARVKDMRGEHGLGAFVLLCTSSVLGSEFRRRKVRRFLGLTARGDLPEQVARPRDDDAREVLDHVSAILDRASHTERMAFLFRYVEGLSLPEMAVALDVSEATLKRKLGALARRMERALARDLATARYLGLPPTANEAGARKKTGAA